MSFEQVKSHVLHVVKSTPSFPRISSRKLATFCTDIALVTLGFRYRLASTLLSSMIITTGARTAYLLDLFYLSETISRQLVSALGTVRDLLIKHQYFTKFVPGRCPIQKCFHHIPHWVGPGILR